MNVSFRRTLQGNNLKDWLQVVSKIADVELVQGHDIGIWTLQQNGLFSVHSMYLALMDDKILPINRPLWKLKIPLKVKVFIWLLHRGVHWPREVHCQHGREEPEPRKNYYLGSLEDFPRLCAWHVPHRLPLLPSRHLSEMGNSVVLGLSKTSLGRCQYYSLTARLHQHQGGYR